MSKSIKEVRKCTGCEIIKPLYKFRNNNSPTEAYFKRCIECREKQTVRYLIRMSDPCYAELQRKRSRIKYSKNKEKYKNDVEARRTAYPEKLAAQSMSTSVPKKDGHENHHWSYNEEHYKDIIHLTPFNHRRVHAKMIYDQERKMYRRLDGVLIDSKVMAEAYYSEVIAEYSKLVDTIKRKK